MFCKNVARALLPVFRKQLTLRGGMFRRGYESTRSGPPKYPLSNLDFLLLGGGFIFTISIIPLWALRQIPKWSEIHNKAD